GSVPSTALQVQLSELGNVFGPSVQSGVALLAARRYGVPADQPDAEGIEQAGPQVAGERHPGFALDDAPQRVGARLVVREHAARRPIRRDEQETPNRLVRVESKRTVHRFLLLAAGHGGDV